MFSAFFTKRNSTSGVAVLCGLLLLSALSGCGSQKNPWETVYPTGGTVKFKGQPVADAEITLFPEDPAAPEHVRPRARSAPNGTFAVWTYDHADGAPEGRYKATVVHHEVVETNGVAVTKPNDLPKKYATLQTTDLIVVVSADKAEIPTIELQ